MGENGKKEISMVELPKFHVFAIIDSESFGVLFEKRNHNGLTERIYFYLDNEEGLKPTSAMKKRPDLSCHKLTPTRYHQIFLNELKAYAVASYQSGNMHVTRELTQKYSEKETFGDIVGRVFERGHPKLKDVLENRKVFENRILKRKHGQDVVNGKAEKYGVFNPDNLFPEDNFICLRPIEKVLEIGKEYDSEWFRRR